MATAGMITEYDPLHGGHVHLIRELRRRLGEDTAVVAVMSGDYVQRGELAVVRRQARARAAVESGVDLVLELPLPWAVSSAEGFAAGAVQLLAATGAVDTLCFGCECGAAEPLQAAASVLLDPAFDAILRQELLRGDSFPAARARAAARLGGPETAAVLRRPNDLLAVEYCKAVRRFAPDLRVLAIPREGAGHDELREGEYPSASYIRNLLWQGEREKALGLMAPAMAERYREEESAGRAPVWGTVLERAMLARLRSMEREEFAAYDHGREGLYHRLYAASREAASLEGVLRGAKTRRYPLVRLRRMVLRIWLGMDREAESPLYLRPLAMTDTGRHLLAGMRKGAALPVLTKAADVRKLGAAAQALFALEARGADLYALAYPALSAGTGGALWREGPWV